MFKRITAFTLFFVMAFSLIQAAPVASDNQPDEEPLLQSLGIISKGMDPGSTVSREYFAGMLARMLQLNYSASGENPFKAEETQKGGADDMLAVVTQGYMNAADGTKFGAGLPLTYFEAVYALVKATGYDVFCSSELDYVTQARQAGLLKGLSYERNLPMTYSEVVRIVINALKADMAKQTGFGEQLKYEVQKGTNLLSEVFDTYTVEGVVNSIGTASLLKDAAPVNKNQIMIGEEVFEFDGLAAEWIGLNVQGYYRQKKNEDEKRIIFIKPWKNEVEELVYFQLEQTAVKGNFRYEKDGKMLTARISQSADLIYNYRNVEFTKSYNLYVPDSRVRLIDNNSDGVFDVVIILSHVNYYLAVVSGSDYVLRDKYGQTTLFLEDADEIFVFKDGKPAAFSDIKPGSAISVIADREVFSQNGEKKVDTANAKVFYIYINSQKVSGTVTQITDDFIFIGDSEYRYADSLEKAISGANVGAINLSAEITALLDVNGNIMAYETRNIDGISIGYLIEAKEVKVPFGKQVMIKVLNENGLVEQLKIHKKVELDGQVVSDNSFVLGRLTSGGITERNLIRFRINKDSEINMLDTVYFNEPYEEKENSIIKNYSSGSSTVYFNKDAGRIFGGKIILGSSPKVFVVPEPSDQNADDDDYYVTDETYFSSSGDFYIDGYNAKVRVSNLIVVYERGNFSNDLIPAVVTSLGRGINGDRQVYVINALENGKKVSLYFKNDNVKVYMGNTKTPVDNPDFSTIQPGDVFRYLKDKNGSVIAIQFLFRPSQSNSYAASGSNYDASYRTVYGRAVDMTENILEVSVAQDLGDENATESFVLSGVAVYELKDNKVNTINMENIMTYKPDKITSYADSVFIFSSRSKTRIVLVVR